MENGVANYNLSWAYARNLVNFGRQTVVNRIGVLTSPMCLCCGNVVVTVLDL